MNCVSVAPQLGQQVVPIKMLSRDDVKARFLQQRL
jgi:hypothetical protein